MRLIVLLLTVNLMQLPANVFSQNGTFKLEKTNLTLKEAIKEIEGQTNYRFVYRDNFIDDKKTIDTELGKTTVEAFLQNIVKDMGLGYILLKDNLVVLTIDDNNFLKQEITIKGNVTDTDGKPLPGVNIVEKGTTNGAVTNLDGEYTIPVSSPDAILSFSYVGFLTEEVEVSGQTTLNITLVEDIQALDEVIVIGYGTMKKSDLTGAIESVSSEDINKRPVVNLAQALQGNASGVRVQTGSAGPGGWSSVTIRGRNSVNSGSEPLYVVDGLPVSNVNSISTLDIESIEVLKDGPATAIYGARGANGVILITTKKGHEGATTITFDAYITSERIPERPNLMNASEFAEFYNEWQIARGIAEDEVWYDGSSKDRPLPSQAGEGTDWFDLISRNGTIQNYQLSVSGGGEKQKYSVSLNYRDHEGIIAGGYYDRFGGRFSNTIKINDWISTGIDFYLTTEKISGSGENQGSTNRTSQIVGALYTPQTIPVYNEDGSYHENSFPSAQVMENPLAAATEILDYTRRNKTFGNFYLNFELLKGLSLKSSFGLDHENSKTYFYLPTNTIYGALVDGTARLGDYRKSHIVTDHIFSYEYESGDHKVSATGGFSYEEEIYESFVAEASGFITDEFSFNNLGAASQPAIPASGKTKWQLASMIGRLNYSLKEKYLFSTVARYDGSSRFGSGNKWGFFPSAAIAWRITEEPFMQGISFLRHMKIRASYGETGNQAIPLYQSLARYEDKGSNYPFGTNVYPGVYLMSLENKDLKWETTQSYNVGVDFNILDFVTFNADAYYKKTTDLLMDVALVETTGFESSIRNVGSLENKGFEFSADARVYRGSDVSLNIKGDFFLNRNKILVLNGDATQEWKIGHPVGAYRQLAIDGILRTQEDLDNYKDEDGNVINNAQLGDYKFRDVNGDGKISGDDEIVISDLEDDFSYGFDIDFKYKNIGLSATFYGVIGMDVINGSMWELTGLGIVRGNLTRDLLNNYWTPENINAEYPRLNSPTYQTSNARVLENGNYLRLQNLMVFYDIPVNKFFKGARAYASMQNLFTITKYSGYNPDVNGGRDNASYPIPRSFTVGFNFSL